MAATFPTLSSFSAASANEMKRTPLSLVCICGLALSATAQQSEPDNSGSNKRDRSGETKTAGDQSNSSNDRTEEIFANAGAEDVATSSLSKAPGAGGSSGVSETRTAEFRE